MATLISEQQAGGESYDYYPLGEYVVRAIGVCGGRPTFKYTRIEIAGILDRLAAGTGLDTIASDYGGRVSREAVAEAMRIVTDSYMASLEPLPEPISVV